MNTIPLSTQLAFPLDAVTRTFGLLAVRGAGKSNTAAVMAEGMFDAGLPFVVVDPVGSWYGLRSSADGQTPGLAIPIFGGKHGDIPLERGAGELVADLIVDKRLSCVLDLSGFDSEGDKKHFLLAFARRLYAKNENPLHLFLEEADDYIPQKPMREESQLLRAFENIVRRGRARGLGMTFITQRSAVINKNVLTQVETLIVMRTTGPQDRDAVEAWVKYHQAGRDVLSTLASLKDGEAWVWSPHFLGRMERLQIRRRRTFDSGATPKNVRSGDSRPAATLADVDLDALKVSMSATIERAKADDPRELRKRIAQLERDLVRERHATAPPPPAPEPPRVEVPVITDSQLAELSRLVEALDAAAAKADEVSDKAVATAAALRGDLAKVHQRRPEPARQAVSVRVEAPRHTVERTLDRLNQAPPPGAGRSMPPSASAAEVGRGGLQRILIALAQRPQGLSTAQIGVRARLSSTSGTFDTYLSRARQAGWIEGDRARLTITPGGLAALGRFTPLPTGRDLLEHWLQELGQSGAARMLSALAAVYPRGLTRPALGQAANISSTTGTFDTYLSRLRRLELVEGKAELRASEELFS